MARYILRRVVLALFVLWAAYTVSFAVLYLLPGDPINAILSSNGLEASQADPAQVEALRVQYGLDKPVPQQYLSQLGHALRGDFGSSYRSGVPVTTAIGDALPQTAMLSAAALAVALVIGVGVAWSATFTRRPGLRQSLLSVPSIGVSLPSFLVGLVLIQLVSFRWGLLPAIGNDGWQSLVLPAITLALPAAAVIGQVLAKSMDSSLAQPYVDTARAKGASRSRAHLRHALRNAAIPALTLVGLVIGNLLAGSVIVETVFSRAGVGRVAVDAVTNQDIPVVQGIVVLAATVFVVVNLAVDLLYPVLDPRIKAMA